MKATICLVAAAICFAGIANAADAPPAYTFQTVAYPGAIQTYALGINDAGDVVGNYADGPIFPSPLHAFLLRGGRYFQIDPPGSSMATATGISNAGQIAGTAWALRGSGLIPYAYLRADETHYTTIIPPGSDTSQAYNISASGEIIGVSAWDITGGAFLWSAGSFSPGLLGPTTLAKALNATRQYVGYGILNSPDPYCGCYDSFFSDGRSTMILRFPGAHQTGAVAINDISQVAGNYLVYDVPGRNAKVVYQGGFIYTNGQYQNFALPVGAVNVGLAGINGFGDVVGAWNNATGRTAFVAIAPRPAPGALRIASPLSPVTGKASLGTFMRTIAKKR